MGIKALVDLSRKNRKIRNPHIQVRDKIIQLQNGFGIIEVITNNPSIHRGWVNPWTLSTGFQRRPFPWKKLSTYRSEIKASSETQAFRIMQMIMTPSKRFPSICSFFFEFKFIIRSKYWQGVLFQLRSNTGQCFSSSTYNTSNSSYNSHIVHSHVYLI